MPQHNSVTVSALSAAVLSLVFLPSACTAPTPASPTYCHVNADCPVGAHCDQSSGLCLAGDPDAGSTADGGEIVDASGSDSAEVAPDASTRDADLPPDSATPDTNPHLCDEGWAGDTCAECADGFYGASCEACTCTEHGTCDDGLTGDGTCACDEHWAGDTCDECSTGWIGDTCDTCADGFYGSNCIACTCANGTCDDGISGAGACTCDEGWAGEICNVCAPNYYGANCEACTCVNGTCADGLNGDGRCANCETGWSGDTCDTCADGFYGSTCIACTCVNGACDDGISGAGACTCQTGWSGDTCDTCADGFYGASCIACDCGHGTCDDGLTGAGTCICETGWVGATCDACAEGYYGASCTACTCTEHGTCDDGLTGAGTCTCATGWSGGNCQLWSYAIQGRGSQTISAAKVNADGDVFVTGSFSPEIYLNPEIVGSPTFTHSLYSAGFLARYSSSGTLTWSSMQDLGIFYVSNDLVIDKEGDIVITGVTATETGNYGIILRKYSANGALVWTKKFPTTEVFYGGRMAITNLNNIVLVGAIKGECNFGATAATILPDSGTYDGLFVEFSPTGEHVKSFTLGSNTGKEIIDQVAFSSDNQIVIGGTVYAGGAVTLGNSDIHNEGETDGFIAKLNSERNVAWYKYFGGEDSQIVYAIAVATDAVYVGGGFRTSITNLATPNPISRGGYDAFIAKYQNNGNKKWSQTFGDSGAQGVVKIATSGENKVYVGGNYDGNLEFPNNVQVQNPATSGNPNIFVLTMTGDGAVTEAKNFGNDSPGELNKQYIGALEPIPTGGVLLGGTFEDYFQFGAENYVCIERADIFWGKIE